MRDHPIIENMERTGYPDGVEPKELGEDSLGNKIYQGDEMYYFEDLSFVRDEISMDLERTLELINAMKGEAR